MLEAMAPGSVTVRTFDVDEEQLAVVARAAAALRRMGRGRSCGEAARALRGLRLSR